nr:MAG: ORF1 [Torque teno midi virus]
MPFWWRRRNKNWWGYRYKTNKYRRKRWPRRRRRTLYRRRRSTRTNRRRRRRHRKVKRKRKTLNVKQWQPESIRKCKIVGIEPQLIGAEGSQIDCFTVTKTDYVPPKLPWGGGFSVQNYNLKYLYSEYQYHNNVWTSSNSQKDLCRYTGGYIKLFRHDTQDFVFSYDLQPPHELTKYTFPSCHPHQMLLQKRHKILLSKQTNPKGKLYKKIKFKPPKQMINKWFFAKNFSPTSLIVFKAAVCNFRQANLSGKNQNMLVNCLSLNLSFYKNPWWAQTPTSGGYKPYNNIQSQLDYVIKQGGQEVQKKMDSAATTDYSISISYDKGWFGPSFLSAIKIGTISSPTATHQILTVRYNPNIDNGNNNQIYCTSTLASSWAPPTRDKQLLIEGMPLWLGLYGYYSFVRSVKTEDFLKAHVICIRSPALYCYPEIGSCDTYVFIDSEFIVGKRPYDQLITKQQKALWYPDMHWQKKTMNTLVESGPFIPKLSDETYSNWELNSRYCFYFKWGGPYTDEPDIANPEMLPTYDVPDTVQKTIQIVNPEKQSPETIIHPWDYRRGLIKEKALKRMCSNISTDTEFQPVTETTPKKKPRLRATLPNPEEETQEIQKCLHSLCEESTYQEEEETNLKQLIQHQQYQQQKLKYNMLKLIIDIKEKQRIIQQQTGLLD